MSEAPPSPRGCSPWTVLGCGCGLVAIFGITFVFLLLSIALMRSRFDPKWNLRAYEDCQHHVRYLGWALQSYQLDYHHLPVRLEELSPRYLSDTHWLHCPLDAAHSAVVYQYFPAGTSPTDPLVTCSHHGQGKIVLLHDFKLLLTEKKLK